MAFDSTAATPGSGFSFAFDTFTDTDAVDRVMAYTGIAFGALGGPYSNVTSSAGLPVAQQGTWTVSVAGMAAHDAAVSGNPVLIAGYASAAAPSDVSADGDVVRLWLDRAGRVQVADGGGSLTVDGTVAATQSGTWTVTTVSTVTNVATIGTSVTPGTSASHLGKAEDAAHSSGDTGVFILSVRADSAASTAGTDGDYAALTTDASGRLWCNVANTVTVGSHAVTNAGTFAVQVDGAALTSLQLIDDVVFAEDAVHASGDKGVMALSVRKDTAATTAGTDGDYAALTTDSSGRLHVNVGNTPTVSLTDISNGDYETVAASQTAQVLGTTGATGDYIAGLLVIPATTSPGNVLLLDNATSITVFTGGSSSVSNLVPFFIPLGMKSVSGAWKVTTGANVSVIGIGNFT